MTIIEQIKAEIERQEKQCPLDTYEGRHKLFILGGLKTFLSTLESEKPINQDEFNTELKRVTDDKVYEYYPEQDGDFITEIDFAKCIRDVARHFAKWGAEHLKK